MYNSFTSYIKCYTYSPASWKRVTHSDSYRVAANCPVGAAAGFAADGGDPSGRQAAA